MIANETFERALALFNARLYSSALQILCLGPESVNALLLAAECQSHLNDHRLSMQTYDLAILKYNIKPPSRYFQACFQAREYHKLLDILLKTEDLDLPQLILLHNCYEHLGNISDAIKVGKCILRKEPLAIEIIVSVLQNGASFHEISALINGNEFLACFAEAFYLCQTCQYQTSIQKFKALGERYAESSLLVQTHLALAYVKSTLYTFANATYMKLKRLHPFETLYKDGLAVVLFHQADISALRQLETQVSSYTSQKECIFVSALSLMAKNQNEKALAKLERILLDFPRYVLAHQYMGYVLCKMNRFGQAATSYRNAYRISRDIWTYRGLIICYLKLLKFNEATITAKEALALFPLSSVACMLAGQVLRDSPKAKQYFEKALEMDKESLDCLLAYAQYTRKTKDASQAIEILKRVHHHTDEY